MASTNSPSVQWVAGESVGKSVSGGTAAIPVIAVATGAAAPTAAPTNGSPFFYTLPASGFYAFDGTVWRGSN